MYVTQSTPLLMKGRTSAVIYTRIVGIHYYLPLNVIESSEFSMDQKQMQQTPLFVNRAKLWINASNSLPAILE